MVQTLTEMLGFLFNLNAGYHVFYDLKIEYLNFISIKNQLKTCSIFFMSIFYVVIFIICVF